MNEVKEFIFERPVTDSIDRLVSSYQIVISRYLSEIHQYKGKLELNVIKLETAGVNNFLRYSKNVKIEGLIEKGGYSNFVIFSFIIHSQDNCCGASAVSDTIVDNLFRRKKLGTILQYFKEDIGLLSNNSMLICTDSYTLRCNEDVNIDELKPYLPNTKLLLNNGWKVSELFYNPRSYNVVALYTKKIKRIKNLEQVKINVSMKKEDFIEVKNVTIGADPELFLRSNDTGEYVPSFFIIQGDKINPTVISEEGHNIQCDNVMVEYGIPPSTTADEFVKNNMFVQNYLEEKVCKPNNLRLEIFPAVNFDPNNLLDERAKHFG
jgi:hypothetical protein